MPISEEYRVRACARRSRARQVLTRVLSVIPDVYTVGKYTTAPHLLQSVSG